MADINRLIHEPVRFNIMAHLYVVQSADYLFLQKQLGLTWGNLASHLSKLEKSGYIEVEKDFAGKKPHTALRITSKGRAVFDEYRENMSKILADIPETGKIKK